MPNLSLVVTPWLPEVSCGSRTLFLGSLLWKWGLQGSVVDLVAGLSDDVRARFRLGVWTPADLTAVLDQQDLFAACGDFVLAWSDGDDFPQWNALYQRHLYVRKKLVLVVLAPRHVFPLDGQINTACADAFVFGDLEAGLRELFFGEPAWLADLSKTVSAPIVLQPQSLDQSPLSVVDTSLMSAEMLGLVPHIALDEALFSAACCAQKAWFRGERGIRPSRGLIEHYVLTMLKNAPNPTTCDLGAALTSGSRDEAEDLLAIVGGQAFDEVTATIVPDAGYDTAFFIRCKKAGIEILDVVLPSLVPATLTRLEIPRARGDLAANLLAASRAGVKLRLRFCVAWQGEAQCDWEEALLWLGDFTHTLVPCEDIRIIRGGEDGDEDGQRSQKLLAAVCAHLLELKLVSEALQRRIDLAIGRAQASPITQALRLASWDTLLVMPPSRVDPGCILQQAAMVGHLRRRGLRVLPYTSALRVDARASQDAAVFELAVLSSHSYTFWFASEDSAFLLRVLEYLCKKKPGSLFVFLVVEPPAPQELLPFAGFPVCYVHAFHEDNLPALLSASLGGVKIMPLPGVSHAAEALDTGFYGENNSLALRYPGDYALLEPELLWKSRSIALDLSVLGAPQSRLWENAMIELVDLAEQQAGLVVSLLDKPEGAFPSRLYSFAKDLNDQRLRITLSCRYDLGAPFDDALLDDVYRAGLREVTIDREIKGGVGTEEIHYKALLVKGVKVNLVHKDGAHAGTLMNALQKDQSKAHAKSAYFSGFSYATRDEIPLNKREIHEAVARGGGAIKGPDILELELTRSCNFNCVGCWIHDDRLKKINPRYREGKKFLEMTTFDALAQDLASLGVNSVQLSGSGEPTLHPQFAEIAHRLKKRGLHVNVITNFSVLDDDVLQQFVDDGLDQVTISLWAGDAPTYVATHPNCTEKTFDAVVARIRTLVSYKRKVGAVFPKIKLYNVISSKNYAGVRQIFALARELSVDAVEFTPVDTVKGYTDDLALSREHLQSIIAQLAAVKDDPDNLAPRMQRKASSTNAELQEFARFLRHGDLDSSVEYDFSDFSDIRVRCARGFPYTRGIVEDLTSQRFSCYFDAYQCGTCYRKDDCMIMRNNRSVDIPFLSVLGIGSFMRRLQAKEATQGAYDAQVVDRIPCYIGYTYSRITSEGKVIPCCKASKLPLGDVYSDRFRTIWFSERYDEFRMKALTLKKSDPYFTPIACYKACDNLGMNLMFHEEFSAKGSGESESTE